MLPLTRPPPTPARFFQPLRRWRTRPKGGALTHPAPTRPGPLLSARPGFEDEAVQDDRGAGGGAPRGGTGRGGGGEGIAVTEP
ncbi:hypothetical protein FNV68_35095 [Streptomyces sp. S1D4-23]|nr:hypothetical protein FNV61_33925 [Streptomyces sp. RLB3-6]QDO10738.1 hypothetical protein FNV68_35095 [Streptomyces sp. S1D4-23]